MKKFDPKQFDPKLSKEVLKILGEADRESLEQRKKILRKIKNLICEEGQKCGCGEKQEGD